MPSSYKEGQEVYIHCGHIKDAYGVMINGESIDMDQISGDGNISNYVKPGKNDIEITVATSMLNAVLEENKDIKNEDGRILDDRSNAQYGLTDNVVINGSKVNK